MRQEQEQNAWLGLHLIPQFGIAKITRLLAHFSSVAELWQASDEQLLQLELPRGLLRQFVDGRKSIDLEREWEKIRKLDARLISIEDDEYPVLLRSLNDRPPLLYIRGELDADAKCVAIVGTRKASWHGWKAAEQLAYELAQAGLTIVSGLAHGIDAAAHRGALRAGGRTIAVMATGIDRIYPQENYYLAQQIVESGAIITERRIGTRPTGKSFPQRNRIISGMSLGVLVAEAPEKSGAMNTVSHANDQGRDVFALPHNIFNRSGQGCNALIQDGAKLVMRVSDVLDELNITHRNIKTQIKMEQIQPAINTETRIETEQIQPAIHSEARIETEQIPPAIHSEARIETEQIPPAIHSEARIETEQIQPANDIEALILNELGADPVHVDVIVRRTNLPTSTVTSSLTLLELKGLAETAGPMQYCRAR